MTVDATWTTAPVVVGAKGRLVLPAAVRRAAHIDEGTELVARHLGEGRVLLETRDAVRTRVWQAAPTPVDLDTAAEIRHMRDADAAATDRRAARRSNPSRDSDAIGAALLERLGL